MKGIFVSLSVSLIVGLTLYSQNIFAYCDFDQLLDSKVDREVMDWSTDEFEVKSLPFVCVPTRSPDLTEAEKGNRKLKSLPRIINSERRFFNQRRDIETKTINRRRLSTIILLISEPRSALPKTSYSPDKDSIQRVQKGSISRVISLQTKISL